MKPKNLNFNQRFLATLGMTMLLRNDNFMLGMTINNFRLTKSLIRSCEDYGVQRLFAANGTLFALFALGVHARSGGGFRLYLVLAFAATTPARFYKVSAFNAA